jgi:hypothetical protein
MQQEPISILLIIHEGWGHCLFAPFFLMRC